MSSFDKLLGELTATQTETDNLAKSMTDAAAIGADGGEGGASGGEGSGTGEAGATGATGEAGATGAAAGELAKSFKVTGPNGEELDAVDGTEMLKSLEARLEATEASTLGGMGQLLGLVKSQGALIKSLSEQVGAMASQGRGRKAMLQVHERPDAGVLNKGGAAGAAAGGDAAITGPTVEEFMTKSSDAFDNKRISGVEFTTIDVACRTGVAVDPALVRKVLGAGK